MILDEIVIQNFGVFHGRQCAKLTPPSKNKPIILFGGLNGNGKTTIIEAVQLALYGKLSASMRLKSVGYDEQLSRLINHYADPCEGAAVEVAFRSTIDSKTRNFRICRAWSVQNERVREKLEIFVDEKYDRVLTETWTEQVESFIPARLSHLFFFDGERIEALADPGKSAQLLKTAIHALLGVDLVDQLKLDLLVLNRRKRKEIKDEAERLEAENLELELKELIKHQGQLKQERASLQNQWDRAARHLKELDVHFIEQGGNLLRNRQKLEQTRSEVLGKLKVFKDQLLNIATGSLPLLLTKNVLKDIVVQAQKEKEATRAKVLVVAMKDRDYRLLEKVKGSDAPKLVIQLIKKFLKKDRQRHNKATKTKCYLDLSDRGLGKTDILLQGLLDQEHSNTIQILDEVDRLENTLHDLDRKLALVPDEEALGVLVKKQNQARKKLASCEQELDKIDNQLKELEKQKEILSGKLDALLRSTKQIALDNMDIHHFIKHSERVRQTLDSFRSSLVKKHASQLEDFILESYRSLLRKKSLISKLKINPENFSLELHNGSVRPLPPEHLSAGERQLLAISMLWGLSRASGRPIPVMIDTPLGRLDSAHRTHLVERYFPFASHQVLLLSTDEEIDEDYFQKLRPRIGHTYQLKYDDNSGSSSIVPGYFW